MTMVVKIMYADLRTLMYDRKQGVEKKKKSYNAANWIAAQLREPAQRLANRIEALTFGLETR